MFEIDIDFKKTGKYRIYRILSWVALTLFSMYMIHNDQTLQSIFSDAPLYDSWKSHSFNLFMFVIGINCLLIEIFGVIKGLKKNNDRAKV
jgi:hypothetical protein